MGCHPTAIYEALAYLIVFGVCCWLYWGQDAARRRPGLILGWFLFGTFTARIFIEKLKFVQEAWELKWVDTIGLNQGQILSIPFIIAGLALIIYALRRPALEVTPLPEKKEN